MTFFADLTPYTYHRPEVIVGATNVGWLAKEFQFPVGKTSREFRDRLGQYIVRAPLRHRGIHNCEFCPGEAREAGVKFQLIKRKKVGLGTAVAFVFRRDRCYAVPDLIYHYVVDHEYKPPEEFIDSVLKGIEPSGEEYALRLKTLELEPYPPAYLIAQDED